MSAEGSDYGVWGSVVSSPSGVHGGVPATIDIFAYLQIKRGLILNKHCAVCQCVQCKKIYANIRFVANCCSCHRAERQSAGLSKITNDGLTQSGT